MTYRHFDDTSYTDEYQNEVYQWAEAIVLDNRFSKIIDIGTGSGYKFIKYFYSFDTLGIDAPKTVHYLKSKYPKRKWINYLEVNYAILKCDFAICSDVIEHVLNPYDFLKTVSTIQDVQMYLFSTPERDILWGKDHCGPPPNPFHVREWNSEEFKTLISEFFEIIEQRITNRYQGTQAILCKPKV